MEALFVNISTKLSHVLLKTNKKVLGILGVKGSIATALKHQTWKRTKYKHDLKASDVDRGPNTNTTLPLLYKHIRHGKSTIIYKHNIAQS